MNEYQRRKLAIFNLPNKYLNYFPNKYFDEKLMKYEECAKKNQEFLSYYYFI